MSRSQWIAAAALMALAVPAAQAGDQTRVQITIAPYWGWGGPAYRPGPRAYRHGYYEGYRDSRYGGVSYYGGYSGGYYGGPAIRLDYGYRDGYYRPGGYRPGGELRYDGRRDRDYYRGRGRGHDRDDRRGRDWRD